MPHSLRSLQRGVLVSVAVCALALLGACGDDGSTETADNNAANGSTNGGTSSNNTNGLDIPAEHASRTNPKAGDAAAASAGEATYKAQCEFCHGAEGRGDGPSGAGLTPPATDLTAPAFQATSDAYIYFRIADGGEPLSSSMPAYGDSLSEDQIWELITFIRTFGS